MPIDLVRFTQNKEMLVPIVRGTGSAFGRKVVVRNTEDGWYIFKFGNEIEKLRRARPLEVFQLLQTFSYLRVYAMGEEGVATNFDIFLRREYGETVRVEFLQAHPFEVAKVVQWEDGRFYFYEVDSTFQRSLLRSAKQLFEKEQPLFLKGATPELRYYYLLLLLQQQSYQELHKLEKLKLTKLEREKRIQEFQSTFYGRLKTTIEKADGELVRYFKANATTYMVHWRVKGSSYLIKSTIQDNFSILDLGFCASGHDREHSMASAIQLAKIYEQEEGHINITRE